MDSRTRMEKIRNGQPMTVKEQVFLVAALSLPAVLSQLTTVIMEYIDTAMVGRLGAGGVASIGLVSSSTWLTSGITTAIGIGFSVQIAQLIGAKEDASARSVMRFGLLTAIGWSLIVSLAGVLAAPHLPVWFGADQSIHADASAYFRIFALFLPMLQLRFTAGSMLQSSGDMKIAGLLNIIACVLDVFFNLLLIFPTRTFILGEIRLTVPGFGLGVRGAALGTALSETVCALLMVWFLLFRSQKLHLRKGETTAAGTYRSMLVKAFHIGLPVGIEQAVTGGAQVVSTGIVSPLGTVSIAANSLAVNAEGLCYMPGFGIGAAASTAVGQSIGAGRKDLTKKLAWIAMFLGMGVMTLCGGLLFIFAPQMFAFLTTAVSVRRLGVRVLRIELLAEPFFAASLVGAGIFRGAGRTRGSTVINLVCMWLIRLPMAKLLSARIGLAGVWIAMCTDLCVRGILFLIRLKRTEFHNGCRNAEGTISA